MIQGSYLQLIQQRIVTVGLMIIVLCALIPVEHGTSTSYRYYVCTSGGNYRSIQDAIDCASEGATIYVDEGTYYENLDISKSLTLVGAGKHSTIIDGYSDELNLIIHISADDVYISGFTIQNSKQNYYSSGIVIANAHHTTITNNTLTQCKDGLILWNTSQDNTIYQNNFIDNIRDINSTTLSNEFNLSYESGGNYWDTYEGQDVYCGEHQNISGSDGIGDTAQSFTYGSDHYPYIYEDGWLNTPPIAEAHGPYTAYTNQEIILDGSTISDAEGAVTCIWSFGDGTTAQGVHVTHQYATAGTYLISVSVRDAYGCTSTDSTIAHIWDSCEGSWSLNITHDSYVYNQTPAQNFGTLSYIAVSNGTGNDTTYWHHHGYLYCNLSVIPTITQITQATLNCYYYDFDQNSTAGNNLTISRVNASWNESNITWYTQPSVIENSSCNATVPSTFGWMRWDVTEDIQAMVGGAMNNTGWRLEDRNAWGRYNIPVVKFKSTETTTSYRPYLQIQYETPLLAQTTGPYQANTSDSIWFNGSFLGAGLPPYDWLWEFGDGNSSSMQNTTHRYHHKGVYTISLTIQDSTGKVNTTSTSAIINRSQEKQWAHITNPNSGVYITNTKLMSSKGTLLIGATDIVVEPDSDATDIKKVEFYINNKHVSTDITTPYCWTWKQPSFPRLFFTISVVAYDIDGFISSDTKTVMRIL